MILQRYIRLARMENGGSTMKPRKTFQVADLREQINSMLLNTKDEYIEGREWSCSILEDVLHKTGNYNGFWYLDSKDMEKSKDGTTVGIREKNGKCSFEFTDSTRRYYFAKNLSRH